MNGLLKIIESVYILIIFHCLPLFSILLGNNYTYTECLDRLHHSIFNFIYLVGIFGFWFGAFLLLVDILTFFYNLIEKKEFEN